METKDITKAIQAYTDAKAAGKSNVDARKAADSVAKVNPNKLNLHWYGDPRNPNGVAPDAKFGGMTEAQQNAQIVVWRAEEGRSWGEIAILSGWLPESRVRTRFEVTAKLSSTGHRTGQGGRFAFGTPELYVGNHKGLGAELSPEELRELRNDNEKLIDYMKSADEYQSVLAKKAAAAKRTLKAKAAKKVNA